MYIQEAVKESLESGKWIRRKSFREVFHEDIRLLPTLHSCIVAVFDTAGNKKDQARNWNPHANDLVADVCEKLQNCLTDFVGHTIENARDCCALPECIKILPDIARLLFAVSGKSY